MSKGGRYLKQNAVPKKKKKKVSTVKVVLLTLLTLTVIGILGGIIVFNNMLGLVERAEVVEKTDVTVDPALLGNMEETESVATETTEEPTTVPTTLPYTPSDLDIINVLVVGQAARDGEEYRYADTMILATVNKNTKTLTLTSFLRDAYVDMPNYMGHSCGWNRINTVYHLGWTWGDTGGAMEMMNICLKDNYGIEVDYNVEIDFRAFEKIIDLLGGVTVEMTRDEAEYMIEHAPWEREDFWQFQEGSNWLSGEEALVYARMRKAKGDNESDIKRTARQRGLVTLLLKKLVAMDFDTMMNMAKEVLPMITTDMTNDEITTCLWEILPLLPQLKIEQGTCPVEGTYWGEVIDLLGQPSSVLKFVAAEQKNLMKAITEGVTE